MNKFDIIEPFDNPEAPPEPQPWWRFLSRLKWVFGIERSNLEVQAFAGTIYASAEGYSQQVPALRPIAASLQKLRSQPDMPAAMACERLYYEALPIEDLRAELWSLRERLNRIATPDAIAAFNTSRISDIATASDHQVLSEVRAILSYTHKSYHLTTIREVAAAQVKWWLLICTVVLLLSCEALVYVNHIELGITHPISLLLGVGAIVLAGGVGAVMSVARRLQGALDNKVMSEDPLFGIAALELGRGGILLSCLIGSIFALLVYGVLLGSGGSVLGLQAGFILPAINADVMLGHQPGIAHALGFNNDGDVARMLVVAFVAGFAERLVPDSIDRILNQGDGKKK